MLNPVQIWKIITFWRKAEKIAKEKNVMSVTKFSQIISLFTQAAVKFGFVSVAQPYVTGNSTTYTIILWAVTVAESIVTTVHALLPSLFGSDGTPVDGANTLNLNK
jgi:hypothetical protein